MFKRILLVTLCAGLSGGASCDITCNGTPFPEVGQTLDRAACTIRIVENAGQATATAEIFTLLGLPIQFDSGQSVQVNGQALAPTDSHGDYSVTIPVADVYTVTVNEPTRGVQTTSQAAPPEFAITSPTDGGSASLSGFTLTDSNPDANLQVLITLVQTLFGQGRRVVVGPFADSGSKSFTAHDLAGFRQGADLSITVTKTSRRSDIAGFASGQMSVERNHLVKATPAP